jgi:protein-S-isoprenylcysteine O-methyltransferase Ste14
MTEDSLFRWLVLAGFLVGGSIGAYHRHRAHTGEPIARREEGWFLLLSIRLVAVVGFVGFVAYLISPALMSWAAFPLPGWCRWCGAAVGAANLPYAWWVYHSLGRNITDTVVTRSEHALVTSGPYRYVRHPFYLMLLFFVVSGTLMAANWFFALIGAIEFSLLVARTRIEEAKLIERFGDDYRDYMRRTGRFVPRLFGRKP